jgi:hypothetical protein
MMMMPFLGSYRNKLATPGKPKEKKKIMVP